MMLSVLSKKDASSVSNDQGAGASCPGNNSVMQERKRSTTILNSSSHLKDAETGLAPVTLVTANTKNFPTQHCRNNFKKELKVIKDKVMSLGSGSRKGSHARSMTCRLGQFEDEMPLEA